MFVLDYLVSEFSFGHLVNLCVTVDIVISLVLILRAFGEAFFIILFCAEVPSGRCQTSDP